ncbi:unnamed protein product [Meloidogyne enterolobii]|uniref:Uncharacterized protein n=1 Tax=Meloidogyne enterolobii TaxID=390850 RepID=A0ACB0Z1L6_MELEN
MLFCLLHPMDHNTGPLARKSTTLCALLLVSIAALLVFAVPGQAEEVGVANHTLERDGNSVTLKPVSKQAKEDLNYAEYVKRFPTVCNFAINKTHIKLLYEGIGCTVELITNETDGIKFTTGYMKKDGCELDKCDDGEASFEDGFSNLLPFAYSRTNKETEKLKEGPIFDGDDCDNGGKCDVAHKKCMKETFLEVSWSKCREGQTDYTYAHTHLIGEYKTGLDQSQEEKEGLMEFNLEINAHNSFKMTYNKRMKDNINFDAKGIVCVSKKNAIVKPKTWNIKNEDGDLKDKRLLVFHLLPQNATLWYNGGKVEGKLNRTRPKCDLFIQFKRPAYEFLQVNPPPTTTTSTTTTPNPKLNNTSQPVNATLTPRSQQGNTTNVQTEEGSNAWIWIFVIFAVIAVICLGVVGFHFYKEYKEIKDEDEKERAFWSNFGDEKKIADENKKRSSAEGPSLEDQFVKEIYERMEEEDLENAKKYKILLFQLYLPLLEEKGFKTIGTFREWRKKNKLFHERGETLNEFNIKVTSAVGKRDTKENVENYFQMKREEAEEKKTKDDKVKKDKTPKDPAPKKTDATE